ncbi:hypothetical protein BKA56DRAFT_680302 [Ilyonectria sp. MPI-CAGE-AT-0026]|nr:hypothetical protein BKA56DRAFT_680302 [Ilyonectria sp. MPI-CAGE-AT-0026]
MAEIVGTVSAAIGIAATALHVIRVLANDLGSIKEASQVITDVKTELHNVQSVIESLQTALGAGDRQQVFRDITKNGNVEGALKACEQSCSRFHAELKELLKHSSDGKLSKRDRFNIGFLARDRVVAFTTGLNVCKSTLGLALNGANLMVAMEQYKQLEVIVKQGPSELQRSNADAAEPEYNTADLATEVARGAELSKGYQELLDFLQSKVEENRTRLQIGKVNMVNTKGAAGITNADGTEGDLDVKIGDVTTDSSKVVVGYSKGVNFDAMFS